MKRKLTIVIAIVMLFALFPAFTPKTQALVSGIFQPDVSDKLVNMLTDSKPGENVDVVVWANKDVTGALKLISDHVTPHPKFGCYIASIEKSMLPSLEAIAGVTKITENYKITAPQVKVTTVDEDEVSANWGLADLQISKLWAKGITGKGVKVGLLDTGVDAEHPALKGKVEKFKVFDIDGSKVDSKPFDNVGHGTHCAGIICGQDPKKKNGPGVAPDARLYVGSVLPNGSGMFAQVLSGMEWILDPDDNPKTNDAPSIVSMSLGGIPDPEMTIIADKFQRQGVCLIASIGNEGAGSVGSPGSIPSVFSVGAYDKNRKIGSYSSGAIIDWEMDPYHDMTITKPDIAAPGTDVYSSYPGGEYVEMSGTSMACPHVAGSAALLLQAEPDLTNNDISYVLSKTADDLGPKGWDIRWGNGAININKAIEYLPKLATLKVDVSGKPEQPIVIKVGDKIVRADGTTTFHLDQGDAQVWVTSFGCASVSKKISLKTGAVATLPYDGNALPKLTYKGSLVGVNGENAIGTIKIAGAPELYTTDELGDFEIDLPKTSLDVEYWAIGFKPVKTTLDLSGAFDKIIKLKPVKTLVATSQLITPSSSITRRFDKYCYKVMDDLGIEYCPVNPRQFKLTYDMLKLFDRVYWFAGEASLKLNDANNLHKYMLNGGKLLLSGRNLLYYEVYRRDHNFTQFHFQVRPFSDDSLTTTSVGVANDPIGDGLVLSLSGGDGAANQLGYDTFSVVAQSKNYVPFMNVLTPGDRNPGDYGFSGVRVVSQTYLGVYLSFGVEGIGNKDARLELVKRINSWFDTYGGVQASFVDDQGKPVYAKISVEGMPENTTDDNGNLNLYYLPQGQINVKASAIGFDDQLFSVNVEAGKTLKTQFQLKNPKTMTVNGQVFDPATKKGMACQIKVYGKDSQLFKTDSDGKFSIKLPKFAYSFKFFKRGFVNKSMQFIDNTDSVVVDMIKVANDLAFVSQITPSWEPTAFAGIGQTYDRVARAAGYNLDTIMVSPTAQVSIEDLEQYNGIIWYCGFNDELNKDWWFDVITQYVKEGGKLVLMGQYIPTMMMERPELAKLLGFELDNEDTQIYTITGVNNDPISGGMLFSLWHPFIRAGLIAPSPSMKPVGNGVTCFNLPGANSIGVRVKTDKQTTVVLGFGFEQMFTSVNDDKALFVKLVDYITK